MGVEGPDIKKGASLAFVPKVLCSAQCTRESCTGLPYSLVIVNSVRGYKNSGRNILLAQYRKGSGPERLYLLDSGPIVALYIVLTL